MSASSPRRLPLLLLLVGLAVPSHASAAPWDFGKLLAKAGGYFSALWAPVGCEILPGGRCDASSQVAPSDIGCELEPDGRCASGPVREKDGSPPLGDVGCEILPDGRCGT